MEEKNTKYFTEKSSLIREFVEENYSDDEDIEPNYIFYDAIMNEDNNVAKELVNLGLDSNIIFGDGNRSNYLNYCCDIQNEEMMNFLIDKTENLDKEGDDIEIPLITTCINGNFEFAKLLLDKGANINFVNDRGETPLMYSYIMGYYKMAEFLLSEGAKVLYDEKGLPLNLDECDDREKYEELIMKYETKNKKPAVSRAN